LISVAWVSPAKGMIQKAKPPVETGGCLPKLTAYEKISN
jgi:hypothetical protein